ncbi:MAG TPA: carboxypeptidase-like regulatory domain-containing protein [Terriglobia bacterium]|nr:carboxypeptidase-like regulatory domain-containing protein [Terriglobia bacterium]
MTKTSGRVILFLLLSFCFSILVLAQSDFGTISGLVRDPSGAVIPSAKVTVTNQSGIARTATTNESGFYTVTNIPPGFYKVAATASGFQSYQSTNNKLDPSGHLEVDVALAVGTATQTVQVTASTATLQTSSAAVQKLVTRQQIDSLELNGRNPVLLAQLAPGAQGGNLAGLTFSFSQGPSHFNGSRNWNNLITVDGAPATRTRANGTSLGAADEDSTEEVQVLGADYDAEYGRSSGGQIRIVTKSGTNVFHGAAYEYVRNTILNANTWQRNSNTTTTGLGATNFVAPDHYNNFGFNIGGPLYIPGHFNTNKDKVFWYFGDEWTRNYYTDQSSLTVPSMLMRQGDFSELLDPNNIYYHKTVQLVDPKTGQPFPNNNLTNSPELSPNGLGLLKAYPAPNLSSPINGNQLWFLSAEHPQTQQKQTIAVDVNVKENHRLRYRGEYYHYFEFQPFDGGTNETPKYFNRPNFTNSLDYTWVIGPTKVNEFLFTWSHDRVLIPVDEAAFLDRTTVGITYPYIYPASEKEIPTRIPSVNMSAFSGLSGGPYPSHSAGPILDTSDSFTWIKGTHSMKFGGLWEWDGENNNDEINVSACNTCTNNQNGQFLFSDNGGNFVRPGNAVASAGAAVANAALGMFDSYSEIGHRAYTIFRGDMYEGFAQDAWSATSKLHVNYGVRYTVIVPLHADWGNMIVFDPNYYNANNAVTVDPHSGLIAGSPTIDQLYNGMVIPGSGFPSSAMGRVPEASSGLYNNLFHGLPNHYADIQKDIQPRLGLAYRLGNKTVLRAGAGRFVTRLPDSDSIFLGGNPPFQPNASVSFGSVDDPGGVGTNTVPLVVTTVSRDTRAPEAWTWNTTFEREMPWQSLLSVAYVGSHGVHLQRQADINQPTLATVLANPGVNINAIRPYLGFGSIRQSNGVATSMYNSLQIGWNRHFTHGLLFGFAYTLSKTMDSGSNVRDVVPDTYNTSFLWGPAEFDARHNFIANFLYNLPFFPSQSGVAGKIFGGWQLSGLVQAQTGTPCSVAAANDYAGVGLDSNFGCGVNGQYWVESGTPKILGNFGAAKWFSTTNSDGSPIFTAPPKGTFNTQYVRDIIHQPGFNNVDLGLFKAFAVTERVKFQFRAEAFNAFNHPNWGGASGGGVQFNPTSSTFGEVTTKGSGPGGGGERNFQLSLRVDF